MRSVAAIVVFVAGGVAHAEPTEVGAFVGPRIFASDTALGYIENAPAHPSLGSSVMFGGRIAKAFFPWLVPEFELAMVPTSTNAVGGASSTNVFWLDPRVHLRFMFKTKQRLQPFIVVGGGSPIALSSARKTFNSGITGDAYLGGGVRFDTTKGFALRFDARLSLLPGAKWSYEMADGAKVKAEFDIGLGIEFQLGKKRKRTTIEKPVDSEADTDKDGIADAKDACIDRPEDHDGFDDLDGCPDIDNDSDRVLDIADKCATVPETFNGFQDDDGCPDTIPAEVDALKGTIEGLLYAEAETGVRDSAMVNIKKIAATMTAHASIRVVLIGHTDDREAKAFAEPAPGQAPPDIAEVAMDLSKARAEAVRQALINQGISDGRIVVEGRGAEEPVSDNAKPKGRLANRRVEIKLYVPKI